MKQCKDCKNWLPLEEFYLRQEMADGRRSNCRRCLSQRATRRIQGLSSAERCEARHKYNARLRAEFLAAYGGSCTCCSETTPVFLTLEHKNGDGQEHRRRMGNTSTMAMLADLKRRGWPKDDYTILCFNCNYASWRLGTCPHQDSARS